MRSIYFQSQSSALDITRPVSHVILCPLTIGDSAIFECHNPLFYKFNG